MKRHLQWFLVVAASLGVLATSRPASAAAAWSTSIYINRYRAAYESAQQDYYSGAARLTRYDKNTGAIVYSLPVPSPQTGAVLIDATAGYGTRWLLWGFNGSPDGHAIYTRVTDNGEITNYHLYQSAGWTAARIAAANSYPYVMWKNGSGQFQVWKVPAGGPVTPGPVYGPYSGWEVLDLAAESLGDPTGAPAASILWGTSSGQIAVWGLDSTGTLRTSFGVQAPAGYRATRFDFVPGSSSNQKWAMLFVASDNLTIKTATLYNYGGPPSLQNISGPFSSPYYYPLDVCAEAYYEGSQHVLLAYPYGSGQYAIESDHFGITAPTVQYYTF